ncbi:hypothetical protein [Paenibacillus kobensis]|uniref:hypothetical protein n=1 Tax=Paenibacillus kobensis TaxID=59841 RepID=UPI000FD9A5FA|nr:hypothetical protein [Paenibacillus kobensis]
MYNMKIHLYTRARMDSKEIGSKFFQILERNKFAPDRVGPSEPLRLKYTNEVALSLWKSNEDGLFGNISGKGMKPAFYFEAMWWVSPLRVFNTFSFLFHDTIFRRNRFEIDQEFQECISLFLADYGFISHETSYLRQHVTGRLEDRMPGIFWCNYFGPLYIDFFGEERLRVFPWIDVTNQSNGMITYLSDDPFQLIDNNEKEESAKNYLGRESFGDLVRKQQYPFETQKCKVPKIGYEQE